VVIQEVTKELADSFNLSQVRRRALVNAVEKGGPADKAGVEAGDIILKFDGKTVNASSDLPRMVGSTRPGSKSAMQVWRKGSSRDLSAVTVGEIPDDEEKKHVAGRAQQAGRTTGGQSARPGAGLAQRPNRRKPWKYNTAWSSTRFAMPVTRSDAAQRRRDPRGDQSRAVQSDLKSVQQFNDLLKGTRKDTPPVTLLVERGDMQTFITIKGAWATNRRPAGGSTVAPAAVRPQLLPPLPRHACRAANPARRARRGAF
jgi:serine protease Do